MGNRSFPLTAAIGAQIVDVLLAFGQDVVFLTRGSPGIDEFIMRAAPLIGRRCFAYPSTGGAENFNRDVELVKDADEVVAFFDIDRLHDEHTGTAHVVAKALDKHKPVHAYAALDERLIYAGSNE